MSRAACWVWLLAAAAAYLLSPAGGGSLSLGYSSRGARVASLRVGPLALRGGSTLDALPDDPEVRAMMEAEQWVELEVPTNETDPFGPVDEVYGPPMVYPSWVYHDLDRAEAGDMGATVRLCQHILSNASEVQWIWRNMEHSGESGPETGGSQDLRDGEEAAKELPDRFPWEDSERDRKEEAEVAKIWEERPEDCARVMQTYMDGDSSGNIEYGKANPDCQLFHSAYQGYTDEVRRVVTETGVDINSPNYARESYLWTALHCAASRGHDDTIAALIELGIDVNRKAGDGETAMHVAAQHGHSSAILTLIEYGGNPMSLDDRGQMPFDMAKKGAHVEAAEVLYQYMDAQPAEDPI